MPFSEYLAKKYPRPDQFTLLELQSKANLWFSHILRFLVRLANHYPTKFWKQFGIEKNSDEKYFANSTWQSTMEKYYLEVYNVDSYSNANDDFINAMDNFFLFAVSRINSNFSERFYNRPFYKNASFYPFGNVESGVIMVCRVRAHDDSIVYQSEPVRSYIGASKDEQTNIKRRMAQARKAGGLPFLDKELAKLTGKKFLDLADTSEPHAEDDFFISTAQELISKLISLKEKGVIDTFASDIVPASLLIGSRVEFIMSTTPCGDCRHYFRALRNILKKNGVDVPILFFTKSHYNEGEPDFSIQSVSFDAIFQFTNFSWCSDSAQIVKRVTPSVNLLSNDYKAILTLNIFGEALLPRLVAKPIIIDTFFRAFLEGSTSFRDRITSPYLLDWLKFYYVQVVSSLPYDVRKTTVGQLMSADAYSGDNMSFIRQTYFSVFNLNEFASIVKFANTGENALMFFVRLALQWNDTIYKILKSEGTASLELSSFVKIDPLFEKIYCSLFWFLETAPASYQENYKQYDGELKRIVTNPPVENFEWIVRSYDNALHYAVIAPEQRINVLNGILTHPSTSPLGELNYQLTDEQMSVKIHQVHRAILSLCFDEREEKWNMKKLEDIFMSFHNGELPDELNENMEAQSSSDRKTDVTIRRTFPQSQAYEGFFHIGRHVQILDDDVNPQDELDSGHPDFRGSPKLRYVLDTNWDPFLQYLEDVFRGKKSWQLEVIVVSNERLAIEFSQKSAENRSIESLNKDRKLIYGSFVTELTKLTGRPAFDMNNSGGFSAELMATKEYILQWAQHFLSLSFVEHIYVLDSVDAIFAQELSMKLEAGDQNQLQEEQPKIARANL